MSLQIAPVQVDSSEHRNAVLQLLQSYADDPVTGGGHEISDEARQQLFEGLSSRPSALVLLAELDSRAVGLAICFEGFSTFAARPLLNLHDLVVHPDMRGQGVGGALLEAVEAEARRRGCCAITLEVIGANSRAQQLYRRHGFIGGKSIEPASAVMFFKKRLE